MKRLWSLRRPMSKTVLSLLQNERLPLGIPSKLERPTHERRHQKDSKQSLIARRAWFFSWSVNLMEKLFQFWYSWLHALSSMLSALRALSPLLQGWFILLILPAQRIGKKRNNHSAFSANSVRDNKMEVMHALHQRPLLQYLTTTDSYLRQDGK